MVKEDKAYIIFSGSFPKKWWEKIASKTIKSLTNSQWSHVSVAFLEDGIIKCVEATTPKVVKNNLYDWLYYPNHQFEIYEIDWNAEDFKTCVMDLYETYKGKPYGYTQLILTAIAIIFRLKSNIIKWGLVCSELIYYIMTHGKAKYKKTFEQINKDPNLISPADIYQIIKIMETLGFAKLEEKCDDKGNITNYQ